MASQGTFGRRASLLHQPLQARAGTGLDTTKKHVEFAENPVNRPAMLATPTESPSLDDELREWKQARKKGIAIPWRPLSLMASLCFGIASFVLPASVSDALQWPLYALMAASFCAGLARRREARG